MKLCRLCGEPVYADGADMHPCCRRAVAAGETRCRACTASAVLDCEQRERAMRDAERRSGSRCGVVRRVLECVAAPAGGCWLGEQWWGAHGGWCAKRAECWAACGQLAEAAT